jgi:hypothetical protein
MEVVGVPGKLEAGVGKVGSNQRVRGVACPRQVHNHQPGQSTVTKQRDEGGICPGSWDRDTEGEREREREREREKPVTPCRKQTQKEKTAVLKETLSKAGHEKKVL